MIKVNLLSNAPGATPPRDWFPREQRTALIGLGMLVVTGVIVGGWWYYLGTVQSGLDRRITASEAQLEKLKEASKLVEKTNARRTELAERLGVIERLREAKRGPVNLLETLSTSLPEGLWLLEVKQAGTSVQVDGRAMSLSAVTDFTERMQNSGLFNRPVEILTTTTETVEEANVVRFAVKAEFVKPTVPASASGVAATAPKTIASTAPARTGV